MRRAFTLIELMVVVIIIAALAAMLLPHVLPRSVEARKDIARGEIAGVVTALKMYYLDNNRYPTAEEGLAALIAKPSSASNWKGPYLEKDPSDPWGQKYRYRYPGSHTVLGLDVWSVGPDGQDGTEDDVWPQ